MNCYIIPASMYKPILEILEILKMYCIEKDLFIYILAEAIYYFTARLTLPLQRLKAHYLKLLLNGYT